VVSADGSSGCDDVIVADGGNGADIGTEGVVCECVVVGSDIVYVCVGKMSVMFRKTSWVELMWYDW
jgi:hypothetical protein